MPKQQTHPANGPFAKEVVRAPLSSEVSESFLAYSLSVITSRAIPDVRDGLKPVQRRILYSMLRMGLRPENPHRKCARVVGDTMGHYHPHGDESIYNSLVWMGQNFSRAVPLVDPQGNFGTLDDPPAASRYTECRLSSAAIEMLADIDESTVDFRPNYDGETTEPVCLPAKLPNLLLNGTSGIAVGMTTSMAPHNLREVSKAVRMMISNPKTSTKDLLKVVKGPDFPSGGLVESGGLLEAYESGQGSFKVRARAEVIGVAERREAIVFTELPYLVGPELVVSRIKDQVDAGRVPGVADVRNLSDRHEGLRVQVDCHPGIDAGGVLENLWNQTPVETTFTLKNMVLVAGAPRQLGLREILAHFVIHRLNVVERRTRWRLGRATERLHICEGLLVAIDNIDEMVAIIRAARTTDAARSALRARFGLSGEQAEAVLALRLRGLVGLERLKLTEEMDELASSIKECRALLASEELRSKVVMDELDDLARRFGRPRRTDVLAPGAFKRPLAAGRGANGAGRTAGEAVEVITLSSSGLAGRAAGGVPRRRKLGRHDLITAMTIAPPGGTVWAVTSTGRAVPTALDDIPEVQGRSRGSPATEVFGLSKDEAARTLVAVDTASDAKTGPGGEKSPAEFLLFITRLGFAKRMSITDLTELSGPTQMLSLEAGDEVAAAFVCGPEADLMVVSSDNLALRTPTSGIVPRRVGSGGVTAMKLRAGARVVAAGAASGEAALVALTSLGAAKATPCGEFRSVRRGGQGSRICDLDEGEDIQSAYIGPLDDTYALTSAAPRKAPDGEPIPFTVPATKRGLRPFCAERAFSVVALRRW